MGKFLLIISASVLGYSVYANDAIYGGFNPASRCDNPAGLENPIGVKKSVCRDMLANTGIYACITPKVVVLTEDQSQAQTQAPAPLPVVRTSCLKVREQIVIVAKGKLTGQEDVRGQLNLPAYCSQYPELTDELDASLVDPLINVPRSNNEYLRSITVGEYRAACEDLRARGAL